MAGETEAERAAIMQHISSGLLGVLPQPRSALNTSFSSFTSRLGSAASASPLSDIAGVLSSLENSASKNLTPLRSLSHRTSKETTSPDRSPPPLLTIQHDHDRFTDIWSQILLCEPEGISFSIAEEVFEFSHDDTLEAFERATGGRAYLFTETGERIMTPNCDRKLAV